MLTVDFRILRVDIVQTVQEAGDEGGLAGAGAPPGRRARRRVYPPTGRHTAAQRWPPYYERVSALSNTMRPPMDVDRLAIRRSRLSSISDGSVGEHPDQVLHVVDPPTLAKLLDVHADIPK